MKSLLEELGYSKFDIETRMMECWNNIFDQNNPNHFYFEDKDNTGYMKDTGNNDVRTEGMSFGMMMSVQMNRKDVFDRIWKWARTNMYLNTGYNAGFFSWSNQTNGTKNSEGPAPDGEEYFIMALFFASERWGNGEGIFNYEKEARILLDAVVHAPARMWNHDNYLIRFVCECNFTDPGYHLPHFYEIFAERCNEQDKEFWLKAAKASREYLNKVCHPVTGLAPEYAENDGRPLPKEHHGTFFSDSYKVCANIGMYTLWRGVNTELSTIAEKIIQFFDGKKAEELHDYLYDGKKLPRKAKHPVGLIATIAQGALAVNYDANKEIIQRAVKRFWDTPIRTGKNRYYDNCLYFFAMLALSGKYIEY